MGEDLLRDGAASSTGLHHEKKMTYFNIHKQLETDRTHVYTDKVLRLSAVCARRSVDKERYSKREHTLNRARTKVKRI